MPIPMTLQSAARLAGGRRRIRPPADAPSLPIVTPTPPVTPVNPTPGTPSRPMLTREDILRSIMPGRAPAPAPRRTSPTTIPTSSDPLVNSIIGGTTRSSPGSASQNFNPNLNFQYIERRNPDGSMSREYGKGFSGIPIRRGPDGSIIAT